MLLSSALLSAAGCALPRVVTHRDALTPVEHLNLGVTYERQGDYELAVKQYKKAASGDTRSTAYAYLGNVHFLQGDAAEAERCYRRALKHDPDNADACNNLAWLYCSSGINLEEAERLALRALSLNPARSAVYTDTLRHLRARRAAASEATSQ